MMNRNILNPMMWTTGSGPTPTDYGIYWKPSLGLISLSSDGETRITIADKNLGASQVYNDGDTLSENNCGRYFQWGNNYGFPWTGTMQTSSTQVDASNYGPYYESDTFIKYTGRWDSTDNRNLWGGVTGTNKAMQGPAPDGFHVPSNTEWQAVRDIRVALGGGRFDGTNFGIALKMPFAGYRLYSSAGVDSQGTQARYWSSTRYSAAGAYYLFFNSSGLAPQDGTYRSFGFSVRCFKDTPIIPTSSWTKLYGTSIEAGGIFWSSTDGLISLSSDGQTWITISDKNLGATTVWNSGDTLSEANCGKYYQRGNNYGFPRTGTIANQSTTQVDATNYGPYYYDDTYIYIGGWRNWSVYENNNLRGDITDTIKARKGPCGIDYHVPSKTDINTMLAHLQGLSVPVSDYVKYLKIPYSGYRVSERGGDVRWRGEEGGFWSTKQGGNYAEGFFIKNGVMVTNQFKPVTNGINIRPFKNTPVIPDSTWTKLF